VIKATRFHFRFSLRTISFSPDQVSSIAHTIFHTFYSAGADKPSEFFGLPRTRNHQPNGTRIAFWADTRGEIDRIAELVRQAGGKNPEGPETCVDYSPGYYAFFFEDPDGNKLEICCRESPIVAA
jgi:catechol 2,3-dioxygenase-like lactoylglutathione lyase family enzyme